MVLTTAFVALTVTGCGTTQPELPSGIPKTCDQAQAGAAQAAFERREELAQARASERLWAQVACDQAAPIGLRQEASLKAAQSSHLIATGHLHPALAQVERSERLDALELTMSHALRAIAHDDEPLARALAGSSLKALDRPSAGDHYEAIAWYLQAFVPWTVEQGIFAIKAHQAELGRALDRLEARAPSHRVVPAPRAGWGSTTWSRRLITPWRAPARRPLSAASSARRTT